MQWGCHHRLLDTNCWPKYNDNLKYLLLILKLDECYYSYTLRSALFSELNTVSSDCHGYVRYKTYISTTRVVKNQY